jgi:hypothetical protein
MIPSPESMLMGEFLEVKVPASGTHKGEQITNVRLLLQMG